MITRPRRATARTIRSGCSGYVRGTAKCTGAWTCLRGVQSGQRLVCVLQILAICCSTAGGHVITVWQVPDPRDPCPPTYKYPPIIFSLTLISGVLVNKVLNNNITRVNNNNSRRRKQWCCANGKCSLVLTCVYYNAQQICHQRTLNVFGYLKHGMSQKLHLNAYFFL